MSLENSWKLQLLANPSKKNNSFSMYYSLWYIDCLMSLSNASELFEGLSLLVMDTAIENVFSYIGCWINTFDILLKSPTVSWHPLPLPRSPSTTNLVNGLPRLMPLIQFHVQHNWNFMSENNAPNCNSLLVEMLIVKSQFVLPRLTNLSDVKYSSAFSG